jgi:HAE1 family hydrophobic/amphiphilic exporter-1
MLDQQVTDRFVGCQGWENSPISVIASLPFASGSTPTSSRPLELTSADVRAALESQNRLVPAGQVGGAPAPQGQEFTFTVQLQGRLRSIGEFEDMILKTTNDGSLVRLRDVGRVSLGGENYNIQSTDMDGVPSVGMLIYQLSGSNAVEVAESSEQRIHGL